MEEKLHLMDILNFILLYKNTKKAMGFLAFCYCARS